MQAAHTLQWVEALRSARARTVRVGGRVMSKGPESFVIADGSGAASVAGSLDGAVGDLVVVDIRRVRGAAVLEHLVMRKHAPRQQEGRETEARRIIDQGAGRAMLLRAKAFAAVRRFFGARGFVEVDTPVLVPSPGLDVHLDAIAANGGWLATSPEYQMKRLLAGGMARIFQIAHVFRKGEIGSWHNPEFTMLEWYRTFSSVDDVMADTEALVRKVVRALTGAATLEVLGHAVQLGRRFSRISVLDAFERFADVAPRETLRLSLCDEDRFFRLLVEKVEPGLARSDRPVFLFDFPIAQASLARPKPEDARLCERFELYVGGVELCNGFGELTDPAEQRARLVRDQEARMRLGKPVYPIDERFLSALAEGMPPSSGNALGLDRLVALCLGASDIARTMAFPAGWL
jgi:elongation factor P--(R)-beta-lysine ligase